MKVGIEVEGRYRGLRTMFMTAGEFLCIPPQKLLTAIDRLGLQQLYISDHENTLNYSNPALVDEHLGKRVLITLEVTWVASAAHVHSHLHLILTVSGDAGIVDSFMLLKDTDQVKFSRDQLVYCVSKESMYKTLPAEFEQDETIDGDHPCFI